MEADDVDCLSSCGCCPDAIEDITEGDVLEEGGFVFKTNHPRLFHLGEHEFLPGSLGGTNGRLVIDLVGPVLLLE